MRLVAIPLLMVLACPAAAQEALTRANPVPHAVPRPVLYCTDGQGQRRELGEVICITASCQTWLARCDMSLNNVTWRKIQDGCPGVSLEISLEKPRASG